MKGFINIEKVREYLFQKKTLYVICFIALCFIDFLRNTQTGDVWRAASNCTGLVLAVIIFSAYPIKKFYNCFSYVWTGVCLCIVGGAIVWGDYFIYKDIYKWTFIFATLNIWWLGIYGWYFAKEFFIKKTIDKKIGFMGWLWIAFAFFMSFNRSGRLWPLWFFLMFSAFYITEYKEKDFGDLVEAMINGTIIAFFILQMYCYAFRPYDEIRYKGAYPNSNVAGVHYVWVYTVILIKLHFLHKRKARMCWKVFYFVGAAGMLDFMIMTFCRSAWLTAIVLTLAFGVYVVIRNWQQKWWSAMGRGIALLTATIILFPVTFATVRWLPTIHPHPIWHEGEYQEWRIHAWDPPDAGQYTELDEFLEQLLGRLGETFNVSCNNPLVLKVQAAETGEAPYETIEISDISFFDGAMNGRFAIYKAYIKDMTWLGNPESAGHYRLGEGDNAYISWHAQNLFIQVGFSYGISAGILLLALTFILLFRHSKQFLRESDNLYAVVPLLICIMFFTFGLTELNWNVGQYPLFLVFFVQHPLFSAYCSKIQRCASFSCKMGKDDVTFHK